MFCTWGVEKWKFSMLRLAARNQSLAAVSASRFTADSGTADTSPPRPSNTARDTRSSRFSS